MAHGTNHQPEVAAEKNGMTARKMLAKCPPEMRPRIDNVRVLKWKRVVNPYHEWTYISRTYTTIDDEGRPIAPSAYNKYLTTVSVVNGVKGLIKVDCTCPSFPYWGWEYALNQKNAADIMRGDGSPPDMRNAKMVPAPCKHIAAMLLQLIRSGAL